MQRVQTLTSPVHHAAGLDIANGLRNATAIFIVLVATLVSEHLMAVEEAEYRVVEQFDNIEIREYAPSIIAEVTVEDSFEDASNKAFRKLFKYISGNNQGRSKIDMTAPVTQESKAEKIAMTSPVGQRAAGQLWAISFMMPASYTMETIPLPKDPSVVLKEVPAYRAAVIRYSGRWTEKSYQKHLASLQTWLSKNDIQAINEPVWARYNAPFTPWFMRRNEILMAIDSGRET